MTTNVLPIIRVSRPNGERCDVNAYHITMIDYRHDSKGYSYPTVCLSNGVSIAVTEEEAKRVAKSVSKLSTPPQTVSSTCKYKTPSL